MKKLFLSMLVMACAFATASAQAPLNTAFTIDDITYMVNDHNCASVSKGASTLSGIVTIPSQVTYDGYTYTVDQIYSDAFKLNTNLTGVNFPNTMVYIGANAFWGCSGLTSINIPGSVKELAGGIFELCSNLSEVTLNEGLEKLWRGNFAGTAITSITIPASTTFIQLNSFTGCNSLESIVVAAGNPNYESRNSNAIIVKVAPPTVVGQMEQQANELIAGCKTTVIPNSVVEIGDFAFQDITALTSITIPSSVTKIDNSAFRNTGLTSIVIPESVTTLGENPFVNCAQLETMVVAENNPTYDSHNSCNAIIQKEGNTLVSGCKNTIIPNDVVKIGKSSFRGIITLQAIVIPEGVTTIDENAFTMSSYNNVLKSVTLPSTLTAIGTRAFSGCTALDDVYCYPAVTTEFGPFSPMGFDVWSEVNRDYEGNTHHCKLHVYPEYVSWYSGADQWSSFDVVGDLIHDAALNLSYGIGSGTWTNVPFEKDANGNWVLTQELAANTEFKVYDQDNNWYGGSVGVFTKDMIGTNLSLSTSGSNIKIPVAGTWTFTVTPDLQTLVVTGTWNDILTLKGSFLNNWAGGKDFVLGEDGKWTITQEMQQGDEFKFVFNNTTWIGAESGNNTFTEEMIADGTPLNLIQEVNGASSVNFISPVYGNWTLTVDLENNTLVVSGQWPEPEYAHVYILGEVDKYSWDPSDAPEMNTTDGIVYTYDANFDGRGDNGENYFSFTTELGKNWDDIASFRFGAVSDGDYWFNNEQLGVPFALTYKNGQSIRILAGDYTLKVNLEDMTLTITNQSSEYPVGDVNGDYVVDVSDINILVNIILGTDNAANYDGRANVNGADDVDVSDINMVVNIMLGQNN